MAQTLRVLFDDSLAGNPAGTGTFVRGVQMALRSLEQIELIPAGRADRPQHLDTPRKGPRRRLGNAVDRLTYYFQQLPARARETGCDVIYCPAPVAPLRGNTPAVMTVFDMTTRLYPQTLDPISRVYAQQMLRTGLKRCARICTISRAVRQELVEICQIPAERIQVAYPGPSPELIAAEPEPALVGNEPFLLMVGTLEPRKNHLTALRAFALYRKRRPGSTLQLVLAGSAGWRYQPVVDEIQRLGLSESVNQIGPTSTPRLKWLYQHASGLLFPSIYEGFGLPVLEAMALGCPAAVARIAPVQEITGSDGALLLEPTDVPGWAEAIEHLSSSRDEQRIADARQRAQRFSWSACAESVRDALRLALA